MKAAGYHIETVTQDNVEEKGFFCVKNKKHPGYKAKLEWLRDRLDEGLRIKLLYTDEGVLAGFVEYTPEANSWRVVQAENHLVIHCLWVNSKKAGQRGLSSLLLTECVDDAKKNGFDGVVVVASDGSWMAGKNVYIKNGFEEIDTAPPGFQLLVRPVTNSAQQKPHFPTDWGKRLCTGKRLRLMYTNQCPYIGKMIKEIPPVAESHGIPLILEEIPDAKTARRIMPSPYGVMALVYDGQLLADHAISATRFRNILTKDLQLSVR
ncbi:MAG: GNAT family N-acetyltransferase [Rhodothermales bacterium]|nr:GNAT family N-acetyltransferase [Rhodothermales bacterium]